MSDPIVIEVATGGDPQGAFERAVSPWVEQKHIYDAQVAHDEGCPCTSAAPMFFCTCELVEISITKLA